MFNLLNIGDLLSTTKDIFKSLLSNLPFATQTSETETPAEPTPIDYTQFKKIFLNTLKEKNIVNEDLSSEDGTGQNISDLGNRLSELEFSLINMVNTMVFNHMDNNQNGLLEEEEKEEFTRFLEKIYNDPEFLNSQPANLDVTA